MLSNITESDIFAENATAASDVDEHASPGSRVALKGPSPSFRRWTSSSRGQSKDNRSRGRHPHERISGKPVGDAVDRPTYETPEMDP